MRSLKDKKIVAGICGGIAAYKTAGIVSKLVQAEAEVQVIMTHAASQFITPLTFEALTHRKVFTNLFQDDPLAHVELAHQTHLLIVMPATYHVIGKLASGLADDMLTTTLAATRAAVLVIPAMESQMYTNPIFQENCRKLRALGYRFLGPESGYLASGRAGIGRFPDEEKILKEIETIFVDHSLLSGLRILVTAGPTREMLDPMRCLTNKSSGKMGYALAEQARTMGADNVLLISGPTQLQPPEEVDFLKVESAEEMREAVLAQEKNFDVIVMAAAVADWRPKRISTHKIKKLSTSSLTIELERTPDILNTLSQKKRKGQCVIGFAAESENVIENAREKLRKKQLDLMVANSLIQENAGPESETNEVTLIHKNGRSEPLPVMDKREVAYEILRRIARLAKSK
ncbi:bifunctional phosphopantothenoylcysteine decarboxylase/phosphopantothenate--cysteine ligase CoaBC [Candidatus Acetothermia bacterium]|nr:bifunctional phosphopantothenoylcysteine decarboxylase/phosphopantothenate--cysteine ligase CoaBC [Candidatus Acetothermia bacterium]